MQGNILQRETDFCAMLGLIHRMPEGTPLTLYMMTALINATNIAIVQFISNIVLLCVSLSTSHSTMAVSAERLLFILGPYHPFVSISSIVLQAPHCHRSLIDLP